MPKYYCVMRPPAPGAIPRGTQAAHQFDERRYVPEIDRMAWGWVRYAQELTPDEIADYELVREPREVEV